MLVDITNIEQTLTLISEWINTDKGRYVCVSNVHMCIETYNNTLFKTVVNKADLVVPDGRPIYWAQKLLGYKGAAQVRGMDLTNSLCGYAETHAIPIGFYGSSEETLTTLQINLLEKYPNLNITLCISPPYRELHSDEKEKYIAQINNSGSKILFIGLGCPKQEIWMAEHKDKLNCVMLGVGAAFDFIAGNKKHAPVVIQKLGLEWLYRLLVEPRRLWKRYLTTNPKFVWFFIQQLVGKKF